MIKFETIGRSLVITDTSDSDKILLDELTNTMYYVTRHLDDGYIVLKRSGGLASGSLEIFTSRLSNSIDSEDVGFTATSFREFARSLGGFNEVSDADLLTLKHFKYNPSTDKIEADRAIVEILNSYYLGQKWKLSSAGNQVVFTDLEHNIDSIASWGAISFDGEIPLHYMVFSEPLSINTPDGGDYVGFRELYPINDDMAAFGFNLTVGQAFNEGDVLRYRAYHYGGSINDTIGDSDFTDNLGIKLYQQDITIGEGGLEIGENLDIVFDHPLFVHNNDVIYDDCVLLNSRGEETDNYILALEGDAPNIFAQTLNFKNYKEAKVMLGVTEDLTVSGVGSVGGYNDGDIITPQHTFSQILNKMLNVASFSGYILPTLNVIFRKGNGDILNSGSLEIGTSLGNVSMEPVIVSNDSEGDSAGDSYLYNGNNHQPISNDTGAIVSFPLIDNINIFNTVFTVVYKYLGSLMKKDSHGNDVPLGRFGASQIQKQIVITSYYNRFFGAFGGGAIDSNSIRALSRTNSGTNSFILNTNTVENNFIIAIPANLSIISASDIDTLGVSLLDNYIRQPDLNVDDAGGNPILYKIYTYNRLAGSYTSNHRHDIKIG